MGAPYVGKRVRIVNTSREDLNGSEGLAQTFDDGRYTVRLDKGSLAAFKPANLEEIKGTSSSPRRETASPPPRNQNTTANGAGQREEPNFLNRTLTQFQVHQFKT